MDNVNLAGMTGNPKIDGILSVLSLLVPVCSALSSLLNHLVRLQTANGKQPNAALLGAGAVLNVASVNLDKGVQFARMALGKPVPQTSAQPSQSDAPIQP